MKLIRILTILFTVSVMFMMLFTQPKRELIFARADEAPAVEPVVVQPTVQPEPIPENGIYEIIDKWADVFGVDKKMAHYIVECESTHHADRIGDGGTSYGLWQWHLPAHPDITKECALDPTCSTILAMKTLKAGGVKIWTCGRYYENEKSKM